MYLANYPHQYTNVPTKRGVPPGGFGKVAEWLKATDCKVRSKSNCNLPVSIHTGCIVCKSMAYFDAKASMEISMPAKWICTLASSLFPPDFGEHQGVDFRKIKSRIGEKCPLGGIYQVQCFA